MTTLRDEQWFREYQRRQRINAVVSGIRFIGTRIFTVIGLTCAGLFMLAFIVLALNVGDMTLGRP